MVKRSTHVLVLVLSVLCLATALVVPDWVDPATVADAQSTTTSSSSSTSSTSTIPTTTTLPPPAGVECTPTAPCDLATGLDLTVGGIKRMYSRTPVGECFAGNPGQIPAGFPYGDGRWVCTPDYDRSGDWWHNQTGSWVTFEEVQIATMGSAINHVKVWVVPGAGTPVAIPTAQFPHETAEAGNPIAAVATCPAAGDYTAFRLIRCTLSNAVEVPPGWRYVITYDAQGALWPGGGGTNWGAPMLVRWDMLQKHAGLAGSASNSAVVYQGITTTNHGSTPAHMYWGRFVNPPCEQTETCTTTTTTTPSPVVDPRDLDDIREPPEGKLTDQCAFALWNDDTQRMGGAGDPLEYKDWQFWNDALCLLDAIAWGVHGLWETTYDVGRQTLELLVLSINSGEASFGYLGFLVSSGFGMLNDEVSGLSTLLGFGGPLALTFTTGHNAIVDALEALDLEVTIEGSGSDSWWAPVLALLGQVVTAVGNVASSIVTAIAGLVGDLVTALSNLAITLSIPSQASVDQLTATVSDVPIVETATDLATLPGASATAASSGTATCQGDLTVNGQTFSLCESVSLALMHPAWAVVRSVLLGGMAFLVLMALWNRISHHMEH